jgi:hypothetical protein
MTATLTKWYDEHGRHEIFAGGKKVAVGEVALQRITLKDELVTNEVQHDLDKLGIAKTAREEKLRARDAKQKADPEYNAKMAKMYREVVLKEKQPEAGFIPLGSLMTSNGNGNGHSNGNGNGQHVPEPDTETVSGD